MEITDKKLDDLLIKYHNDELIERVGSYEPAEGESEVDLVLSVAEHLLEMKTDNGWSDHDEVLEAKKIIKDIKNGQNLVMDLRTLSLRRKHSEYDEKWAHDVINEMHELKMLVGALKRLQKKNGAK